jgi:hypothetical protein
MTIDVRGNVHAPAGVSTGGRFVSSQRAEPPVDLSERLEAAPDGHMRLKDEYLDDERLFTERYCEVLAKALHERTGWPIVVVSDGPDGVVGWLHAAVRRPDGMIVDIEGVHTADGWLERWGEWADAYGADYGDRYDPDMVDVHDYPPEPEGQEPPSPRVLERAGAAADRFLASGQSGWSA